MLGKKLNLPVFHLDKYFFTSGWKEHYTKDEFKAIATDFALQDMWIIDGNYRASIDTRFERADTIIFLNFPKWKCYPRVFKRVLNRKQPFDKAEGVKEKVDWTLIKWIWNYDADEMRQKVLGYSNTKKVVILKNNTGIKAFLES